MIIMMKMKLVPSVVIECIAAEGCLIGGKEMLATGDGKRGAAAAAAAQVGGAGPSNGGAAAR